MPPIPPDRLTDAQKKAIEDFHAARGANTTMGGPWVPLLRSPEVMSRARAMGDYLRFTSALPPRLSEFVILMTARHWRQQYEWNVHHPIAIKAGLSPEIARAIAEGRRPAGMSREEESLYDFCGELQANGNVSDTTYARATGLFGEAGVIDTVGIVGYYSLLGMVLNVARTPAGDGGSAPPLPAFAR
jgi:4-carboxymuconolactone decarboxylase